jgi:Zn ribbon nucleic-acid-binding protein
MMTFMTSCNENSSAAVDEMRSNKEEGVLNKESPTCGKHDSEVPGQVRIQLVHRFISKQPFPPFCK